MIVISKLGLTSSTRTTSACSRCSPATRLSPRERQPLRIRATGSGARDRAARIQPPALERRRHGCGRRPIVELSARAARLASGLGLVPGRCRGEISARHPRLPRARPRAPGADAVRPRGCRGALLGQGAVRRHGRGARSMPSRRGESAPALRDRAVDPRRRPPRVHRGRAIRDGELHRTAATPARRRRPPVEARTHQRRQLPQPRADVPRDRRGTRERAGGERRVHLLTRAVDHRPLTQGRARNSVSKARRSSVSSWARSSTTSARSAFPRRSSRSRGRSPRRSGSSSRRIPSSASGSSRRSTGSKRSGRSCATVTSATTAPVTPTARRGGHPDRVTDHSRLRRVPRHDDRPPVSQAAAGRGSTATARRRRQERSSTPRRRGLR